MTSETTVYAYGPNADYSDSQNPFGGDHTTQTQKTTRDGDTLTGSTYTSRTKHTYDAMGRQIKVEIDADGDQTFETVKTYEYNHNGLRISETSDGETTEYVFDTRNPTGHAKQIEEYIDGTLSKTYVLGHQVIAQHDAVNGLLILLHDGHGSTRALIDDLTAVIEQYAYNAYGETLDGQALTMAAVALTSWLRPDGMHDPVTGLDYHIRRWREGPWFLTMDSWAGNPSDPQSLHKYLYSHANPTMNVDPTGNFALAGLTVGYSVARMTQNVYDGTVLAVGDALALTIHGAQAGWTANQIYTTFAVGQVAGFVAGFAIGKAVSASGAIMRSVGRYRGNNSTVLMARSIQSHRRANPNLTARAYHGMTAGQRRELAGVAFGGTGGALRTVTAGSQWLQGGGRWGTVPKQVADRLRGRQFADMNQFRRVFWQEVALDPRLTNQFSAQDIGRMKQGRAPIAPSGERYGKRRGYMLHHMQPIQHGGGVYDLENILIVTPAEHQRLLPGWYHFGS